MRGEWGKMGQHGDKRDVGCGMRGCGMENVEETAW